MVVEVIIVFYEKESIRIQLADGAEFSIMIHDWDKPNVVSIYKGIMFSGLVDHCLYLIGLFGEIIGSRVN
ncbi:hypothetical protein D3C84_1240680 [compost metagenome]